MLKFYPSDADTIAGQLARVLGLNPATIAMSNGSTELITWMDHLWVHESVAIPIPTFGRWTDQPMETGKRVDMFPLQESDGFELDIDEYITFIRARGSRVAVLCNPNNPDGGYLPRREILRFMDELADLDLVVIDESFIDFVEVERNPSVGGGGDDPAERGGAQEPRQELRPARHPVRLPGGQPRPGRQDAQDAAEVEPQLAGRDRSCSCSSEHGAEYRESLRLLSRDRYRMGMELARLPELTVFSSQANFLLVKLAPGIDGTRAARLPALPAPGLRPGVRQQARHEQPVPAAGRPAGAGRRPPGRRHPRLHPVPLEGRQSCPGPAQHLPRCSRASPPALTGVIRGNGERHRSPVTSSPPVTHSAVGPPDEQLPVALLLTDRRRRPRAGRGAGRC